ncbi:MAG: AI-2E family transporter [Proteobacteria bacterium]|nr:AI-2E family transporter [Pseudomonadota bacterium]
MIFRSIQNMPSSPEKARLPVVASSVSLGFLVLCVVVYILNVASAIMIPFMMAVFVWYLINAMARGLGKVVFFKNTQIPRPLCFMAAILLLVLGMMDVFEVISHNVSIVAREAPAYQAHLSEMLTGLLAPFHLEQQPTIKELMGYLDIGAIMAALVKMLSGIAGKTVVVMFYTGFLLYEQRFFNKKLSGMAANAKTESQVRKILFNIDIKVQRYIWVKTLMSALAGILTLVILSLWRVDFAVFWGVIAFILNFIPYVGSLLSIILPSAIAMVQFGDGHTALGVLASLAVLHGLIGHMLDPMLMGENLNLSPIFIISSLAMWEMIWGVPGMFLSIPILAAIMITLAQFHRTRPIAILLSKTGVIDEGYVQGKKPG